MLSALIALIMLLSTMLAAGCTAPSQPAPGNNDPQNTQGSAGLNTQKPSQAASGEMLLAAPEELEFVKYPEMTDWNDDELELYELWNKSAEARRQAGVDPNEIAGFTAELTRELVSGAGDNLVWSPVNVYIALAMLAEVTDSETRAQILNILGASGMDALRGNVTALLTADNFDDGQTASLMANSLWLRNGFVFNTDTVEKLAEIYRASSYWGDPCDEAFNEALRSWLKENTGGLLDDSANEIKFNPETVLAICSAIYFKGGWDQKFAKELTCEEDFHSPEGNVKCQMMHKTTNEDIYFEGEGFTAVWEKIPASGNGVWFLLPDEGKSVEDMLASSDFIGILSGKAYGESEAEIAFSMPKIDIKADLDLIPALKELGMTDCFDPSVSDFSPLSPYSNGLYVSKIAHSARIKTDEEGIEAAAFTVIMVDEYCAMPQKKISFTLDRPFALVITGVTGAPLFVGVVNTPGV